MSLNLDLKSDTVLPITDKNLLAPDWIAIKLSLSNQSVSSLTVKKFHFYKSGAQNIRGRCFFRGAHFIFGKAFLLYFSWMEFLMITACCECCGLIQWQYKKWIWTILLVEYHKSSPFMSIYWCRRRLWNQIAQLRKFTMRIEYNHNPNPASSQTQRSLFPLSVEKRGSCIVSLLRPELFWTIRSPSSCSSGFFC